MAKLWSLILCNRVQPSGWMPKPEFNMTNSEEFMSAVASVRACRGTVACGFEMTELDEMAGDCLYVACKDYMKAYAERFPAWHGLP